MATMEAHLINQAYRHCMQMVRSHYENFPVASLAIPKHLRQPISAIYAFARGADDLADEGDLPPQERLDKLQEYEIKLRHIDQAPATDPVFFALAHTIQIHRLPVQLFHDLLIAFKQDITQKRYSNFDEVLGYCKNSANPIGRLLLHLIDEATEENLRRSDAVCSALQIINFLQDIEQDYQENNRIYFPQDEMQQFGITESHINLKKCDSALQSFIGFQINRTKTLLMEGAPLGLKLNGRFGFQLRIMINGGWRILQLLDLQKENCFSRPRLKQSDWLRVTWNALWRKPLE
jgi:squalene synthase HpnC